jgi:hypothetical protein
VSDSQPPGWTPPQEPPPDQPPTWPPPPPQEPPPPPGPTQQWNQQWGPPPAPGGYQQYGYPGYAAPRRTEGNAIAALVCSLASLLLFWWCVPVVAVVALFLASSAKKNIRASGGALDGEGMATAATIISWIHIGLFVVAVIVIVIAAVAGAFDESASFQTGGAFGGTGG